MKKKLALLLALVMMLSVLPIVPMGVFGQTAAVRPGVVLNPRVAPHSAYVQYDFLIDSAGFAGLTSAVQNAFVEFILSGHNDHGFFSTPVSLTFTSGAGFTTADETAFFGALNNTANWSLSSNRRRVELNLLQAFPGGVPAVEGWIHVTFGTAGTTNGISANNGAIRLDATLVTGGAGVQVTRTPLLGVGLVGGFARGVDISAVSVVPMAGIAHLSGIRIVETRQGILNSATPTGETTFNVVLAAERGFRWETGVIPGIVLTGITASGNNTGDNPVLSAAPTVTVLGGGPAVNANTLRDELLLQVTLPQRVDSFVASTTPVEIVISGMSLIPLQTTRTSGNVAIDVAIGQFGGASDGDRTGARSGILDALPITVSEWGLLRDTADNRSWTEMGLVVANLDFTGDVEVTGADPADLVSGTISGGNGIHGNNASITITELVPGTMFRALDRFELRAVQPGVNFTDATVRARVADSDVWGWQAINGSELLGAWADFDGGSLFFGPRTQNPDTTSRVRRLELRFGLSVEAGFAARHGGTIEIEVLRNGVVVGSAVVANVTDPITVVNSTPTRGLERDQFDLLGLTRVADVTVTETAVGNLNPNDELWFHLEATQDGVPVLLPFGNMVLHLGSPSINDAESDMWFELIEGGSGPAGAVGYRVVRPSIDVPGVLTFSNIHVTGAAVPGLDFHVVVSGPQISENYTAWLPPANEANAQQNRARFTGMPYSAVVLTIGGTPTTEDVDGPGNVDPLATVPVTFSPATIVHGAPALLPRDGALLIQARAFTDQFGGDISASGTVVTATVPNRRTGEMSTVIMTLGSSTVTIDGVSGIEIADVVGQPTMVGRIAPIGYNNRLYVPVRFFAEVTGIPFARTSGGGIRFN